MWMDLVATLEKLAFTDWVIFSPIDELVSSGGICLDPATNNVVEYNAVIELMSEESALGIRHLIVRLDSQLVVSQLNAHYSIRHPTLFRKYLRVCILKKQSIQF